MLDCWYQEIFKPFYDFLVIYLFIQALRILNPPADFKGLEEKN